MKAIPWILTFSVLSAAQVQAQEKPNVGPWREWSILTAEDDVHVQALAFSPITAMVAAGQNNGQVRLWHAVIGRMEQHFDCKPFKAALAVSFDDTGKHLLVAGDSGLQTWEIATAKKTKEWAWPNKDAVRAAFAAKADKVVCFTDAGTVETWSVSTATKLRSVEADGDTTWSALAITCDGQHVAAARTNGELLLWSAADQAPPVLLEKAGGAGMRALAFSPDGSKLAAVRGREAVALFEVAARRFHNSLPAGTPPYHVVTFSSDGKIIAAGCGNGAIDLWDAANREALVTLQGHAGLVLVLSFAPDSRMLATSSADTMARVWDNHRHLDVPQIKLEEKELETLIKDLGSDNDIKVSRATLTLSAAVPQTVSAFKKSLRQGKAPDAKLIKKLIEDLSNNQFAVRSKATQKLADMGEAARAELRYALTRPLDLETKRRLESLLTKLVESFQPDDQRLTQRAIVILERIGSAEAKEILTGVLYGVPDDAIIAQARAALNRSESPKK
jgi:WD40 repeat protein